MKIMNFMIQNDYVRNKGRHYRLSKYFIKFPRTSSGTYKAIATFKETTNCKIPQDVGAIWDPGTDFS